MRRHIYAIYGLVRIADEIVDTYKGKDSKHLLNELETEVYAAIKRGYSPNPVVQSFVLTAKQYGITRTLIHPFFVSMLMDLSPRVYTKELYETYIYGSAEVVGLMCLRVFINGDDKAFHKLEPGARSLGSAYQKVNFLRDMHADYIDLGRLYFPGITFDDFNDTAKNKIIKDIEKDFVKAKKSAALLPASSRGAVELSISYYETLLKKLSRTPAETLKQKRIRVDAATKTRLLVKATARKAALRGR
jgi:phytoene/squalene synthetase